MKLFSFVLLLSLSSVSFAQNKLASEPIPLREVSSSAIDLPTYTGTYFPIRCDTDGNIFAGKYTGPDDANPMVKIAPDGKIKATYTLNEPDQDRDQPTTFFVNADGDVYRLYRTNAGQKNMIAKFGKNGEVRSKVTLEAKFDFGGGFGVFKNGEFLLSTFKDSNDQEIEPYNAVFDSSGKLVKEVVLEGDAAIVAKVKNGETLDPYSQDAGRKRNTSITFGAVVAATDGNLYILRKTSPAEIYVVSPSGEVVRKFSVKSDEWVLMPSDIFEKDGRLAVVFNSWGRPSQIISEAVILDSKTGEIQRVFDIHRDIAAAVACYDGKDGFTAIGTEEFKPVFRHLAP
ncbi:MAG TPA: hypothetical protein VFP40_17545 [Terriglobales bacterium]|nr:hypothetical protein [Terriglobales bacterium]